MKPLITISIVTLASNIVLLLFLFVSKRPLTLWSWREILSTVIDLLKWRNILSTVAALWKWKDKLNIVAALWKWRNKLNIVDTMMLIQISLLEKSIDILNGILEKKKKNDRRGLILYSRRLMVPFAIVLATLYFVCPLTANKENGTNIVDIYNGVYEIINTTMMFLSGALLAVFLILNALDILKVKEEYKNGAFARVMYLIVQNFFVFSFCAYIWYIKDVVVSCNPSGHSFFDFLKLLFGFK